MISFLFYHDDKKKVYSVVRAHVAGAEEARMFFERKWVIKAEILYQEQIEYIGGYQLVSS